MIQGTLPSGLSQVDLFCQLDDEELDRLAKLFKEVEVPENGYVVEAGEPSEAFYVVTGGKLSVFRDVVGRPVQLLARLGAGDFFGEVGIFANVRRTASVRANEPSRVLKIAKEDFLGFLEEYPDILLKVQLAAAARRAADMTSALELGRRREVRISLKQPVALELADGSSFPAFLHNLSPGGMCLEDAPPAWQQEGRVEFGLRLPEGTLPLTGRVAWRQQNALGVTLDKRSPNHDMIIQLTIRMLLAQPRAQNV